jgi:hypothetical protein
VPQNAGFAASFRNAFRRRDRPAAVVPGQEQHGVLRSMHASRVTAAAPKSNKSFKRTPFHSPRYALVLSAAVPLNSGVRPMRHAAVGIVLVSCLFGCAFVDSHHTQEQHYQDGVIWANQHKLDACKAENKQQNCFLNAMFADQAVAQRAINECIAELIAANGNKQPADAAQRDIDECMHNKGFIGYVGMP